MVKQIAMSDSRDIWVRASQANILHVPFLTYTWHRLWYESFGTGWEPFLLSVNDVIIAPLARKGDTVQFSGGEEIADYLDIIGLQEKKQTAWPKIVAYCKTEHIERIILHNVPEDSPTGAFFKNIVHPEDTTPRLTLPSSWNLYVQSLPHKYRHELERKMRKFEREHPNAVIRHSDNPSRDISVLIALMETDVTKREFLTPTMKTFFIRMSEIFASEISFLLLYIDKKPAAATISFINKASYYLYNSGFDKICCKNAGFYLKAMTIRYAIEKKFHEYNFLQGNERYKYELGGVDFGVYTIDYKIPIDR